ncbi:MAG: 1-deoxy-D-xylulose-5-phosphate synthase [Desulfuromonadales bacterium]
MSSLLERLNSPSELEQLSTGEMETLATDLRDVILETVAENGGHLASSLGVVELSIALHRVFSTPDDKIVWDVGHQAYAHKLLTGRLAEFHTLRQYGGMSGFPKREESPHDAFDVGHSSTSISAALGMVAGRELAGGDEKVVAVIGDGSLTSGLAFEGLNQVGHLEKDMIVILNDNEMSISPNVGAISSFLSRKLSSDTYHRVKRETENLLAHLPRFGKDLVTLARRAEESIKGFLTPGMLFEAFGFDYYGPINGHDLDGLVETLENVKHRQGPVLVHVLTKKGKGYEPAETQPDLFHGVGPFDRQTGMIQAGKGGPPSYTAVFGQAMSEMARDDGQLVAITAAMTDGTGLKDFAREFPDRFFDVGIAEQHAVTFAAGLACRGMRPVVALYSTFLQRAYDNVLHDVCLQKLPVTLALDRGGLVGADGPTHHGVFDLSYLRHMPHIVFMVPRNEVELRRAMETARRHDGPFAYRYPRGNAEGLPLPRERETLEIGKGEKLRDGSDGVILAVGTMVKPALEAAEALAEEGVEIAVVDPRFIKPLDRDLLVDEGRRTKKVVTVEENVLQGGFGSAVLELFEQEGVANDVQVMRLGLPDAFIEQGTQKELRAAYGLDADGIGERIREFLVPPIAEAAGKSS